MIEKSILIVDDDVVNIFVLKVMLKFCGYWIDIVLSVWEAIDLMKKNEYVVVLLFDMMMFEIDGYEVILLICVIWFENYVLIVVVIVQVMNGDWEKCFEVGVDDYILKLIDVDKFEVVFGCWM